MLAGMINVAKARAQQRAQTFIFRKLPQGVALADRERYALLLQSVALNLLLQRQIVIQPVQNTRRIAAITR